MTNENTGHSDSDQLLASYRDGLLDESYCQMLGLRVVGSGGGFFGRIVF